MSVSQLPSLAGALGQLGLGQAPPPAVTPGPRRSAPTPQDSVDWPLVVELRREAAERISAAASDWATTRGTPMPDDDRRVQGRAIIRALVQGRAESLGESGEALWPIELESRYADAVENAIFGYGRFQPLFDIPDAENIEIHGFDSVMVQYGDGSRRAHPRSPTAMRS